ncbi:MULTISPECIES: Imm71 family immunity protein [Variovorax]|uniref:Immunity protein 72 domain-containing protein n=1 Tax=Variovorax paradoxus TaxID=34073 RepID=A0A5Q0M2U5_VARPD|nr:MULTISPECIES: Imm71 family immunity protein [Variovorax]QFZ82802.1 hypothetical protein GFK26_08525 [Variovorax paradoxus]WPG37496.1 Imm71 family immunity protein [Variovorax boronicumulans]
MTVQVSTRLPNELERKQIFYALKRWTSYTAWERILKFYQAWADITEASLREASAKGLEDKSSIRASRLISVLKGLADLDEAVARLKQGDKGIFKYASYSELARSYRPLDHEGEMLWRVAKGEIGINYESTPLWNEYARTVTQLSQAWSECSSNAIQPNFDGSVDPVTRTRFNDYLKAELERMTFPDSLPEPSDPIEPLLVRTGQGVKFSGIWEPVDAPAPKIISFFKPAPPKGPFPIVGTMAYLHGGTAAPNMASDGTGGEGRPAVWRLLWKDDRYEDGTVPEEEKHYVFLQPQAEEVHVPTRSTPTASLTVIESGQQAPVAGRWLVEDDLRASIEVAAGEVLPLHEGRKVRWTLAAA